MMTTNQLEQKLSDRNLKEISRRTGVPYGKIIRFLKGNSPSYDTMKKLTEYFEAETNG